MSVRYFIARGEPVRASVPVVTWKEHGLQFPGLKPRKITELVCLHWTGSENPIGTFYNVCRKANQSAHFWIDSDTDEHGFATVYQLADADTFAAHCKGANHRAIGIECRNRGNLQPVVESKPGWPRREILRETINGRDFKYCAFLPSQVKSYTYLCFDLCEHYDLPKAFPMEPVPPSRKGFVPGLQQIIPRQLTQAEFDSHKGLLPHFMWTEKKKTDCGIALCRAIHAAANPSPLRAPWPAE